MIRNIIFDIGNVLLDFKPLDYISSKLDDPAAVRSVTKAIFLGEEWNLLDEGKISMDEGIARFIAIEPSYEKEIRYVMDSWHDMLTLIEPTAALLEKLKERGFKLYYLSNYQEEAAYYVTEKYDFFKLFDGGVFSYAEKMKKPNPAIYETLLKRYSLKASESAFIDDMPENVKAAEALGIRGIVFEGAEKLEKNLTITDELSTINS